jgi:arylsulfatase A-like enzyme
MLRPPMTRNFREQKAWALGLAMLASVTLAALAMLACERSHESARTSGEASQRPSRVADRIVMIVIDTLRADRLGLYGGPDDTAPFLNQLAQRSLVFDSAWAPSSWTGPSMASIFTSLYPNQHGVVLGLRGVRAAGQLKDLDVHRLPDDIETIPSFLQSQGYTTFGVSQNINVGPIIGFDRGFDHFELLPYRQTAGAPALVEQLRAWKSEIEAAPRSFVYVHFMDPHPPYVAHDAEVDRERGRDNLSLYDGEIRYSDAAIRQLFEDFGWLDDAVVLITADHGQEFRDHGGVGHGFQLYSELTHVPLLIHHPTAELAGRVASNVSTLDILPTLRELVGAPASPDDAGQSLLAAPSQAGAERDVFSMRSDARPEETAHKRALIRGDYKLIVTQPQDEIELYDLRSDPSESNDLAARQPDRVREMRARLDAQEAIAQREERAPARSYEPSESEARQLEALGYVEDEK